MIVRKKVGNGITRHEQIICEGLSPSDRAEFESESERLGGFVDPRHFPVWLDRREERIARALTHFRLPAPNRGIAYERSDLRSWRYDDDATTPGMRARTEWYLQAYPYQSSFWYLGRILFLIGRCRSAIDQGAWLVLAGEALKLGQIDREMSLKFSGENRLRRFEQQDARRVAGTDATNATKRKQAEAWQADARRILRNSPEIDPRGKKSETARALQRKWPSGGKMPGERSLINWLRGLEK